MAQILILWGLLWLVKTDYSPKYCAVIYACIAGFFSYVFSYPKGTTTSALIIIVIYFLTSWLYFWLVKKTVSYPLFHWIVIIGGALIGLV